MAKYAIPQAYLQSLDSWPGFLGKGPVRCHAWRAVREHDLVGKVDREVVSYFEEALRMSGGIYQVFRLEAAVGMMWDLARCCCFAYPERCLVCRVEGDLGLKLWKVIWNLGRSGEEMWDFMGWGLRGRSFHMPTRNAACLMTGILLWMICLLPLTTGLCPKAAVHTALKV